MTSGAIRSTLEMVEREIARSEAFLQARGSDPHMPRVHIDRKRRDELVHDLLAERRRRLEARLTAEDPEQDDGVRYADSDVEVPEVPAYGAYGSVAAAARNSPVYDDEDEDSEPEEPAQQTTPPRPRRAPAPKSAPKTAAPRFVFKPSKRPEPEAAPADKGPSRSRAAKPAEKLTRADEWVLRYEMQKRSRQKEKEAQEKEEQAACTFRPKINARSEAYAQRLRAPAQDPLVDRLHHEADKRERLRAKARDLLEEEEVATHSFKPQIKAHPAAAHMVPIHERVGEITRRKAENANLRRVEMELGNKDLTFQPKLAAKSEKMIQRQREKAVFNRENSTVLRPVEDRLLAKKAMPRTRSAGPSRPPRDADQEAVAGFLRRQEEFKAARDQRRETYRAEADLPCTFNPQIAAQSEVLVESNHRLWGESQQERVERLAVKDPKRREVLREELGKLAYADCSFHPKPGAARPVLPAERENAGEDVHARLAAASTVAARRQEVEKPLDSECTFAPKVERKEKFSHVKAHYAFKDPGAVSQQIAEELQERKERLAGAQRIKDERDLRACTFRPEMPDRANAPYADGPVVVRGLGRFLELRELARRKGEGPEPKAAKLPPGHVTIPEPFHLSTAQRRLRRAQSAEPTFQPQTNESERRRQVLQLLEEKTLQMELRESLRA